MKAQQDDYFLLESVEPVGSDGRYLIEPKALSPGGFTPSLLNDALLAASLWMEGLTLITHNVGDFKLLAKVDPFRFLDPWPRAVQP